MMQTRIRGVTALIFALATCASAQQVGGKDIEGPIAVVSGTAYPFNDPLGSGTITFTYAFTGTPTGVSIIVQGCSADLTVCSAALTPVSGTTPYITASNGQQTFLGGYARYKVTPTFAGATLNISKVGIQAKLTPSSGSSVSASTFPNGIRSGTASNTDLTGKLVLASGATISSGTTGLYTTTAGTYTTQPNVFIQAPTSSTGNNTQTAIAALGVCTPYVNSAGGNNWTIAVQCSTAPAPNAITFSYSIYGQN